MSKDLHTDEIAAYKYAKRSGNVNDHVIKAFTRGCDYKDSRPMSDRISSVIECFEKVKHANAQGIRLNDYRRKDLENEGLHLSHIKESLLHLRQVLKKYDE